MFHLLPLRADVRAERTPASRSSSLKGLAQLTDDTGGGCALNAVA
jgi:hypothetical protein